ncbi:hypothetical protein PEPNEM18_00060 [Aedoeadaptatus nemausensis]|uniref:DUF4364 domain-containing protein n=1 Tax=Aedoeadaptatus nemausensis TaxID=2582829 RepID=A0A6V6XZ52_9FIRM|nr:DUF4364 family protein [Peptoniphilus nemausensis]CAC9922506.1 hypothetical protein PEPNEM18_00060 [Peptoniphilus nemausensis]
MKSVPIHTLASDKLYILASIKQGGGKMTRRALQDAILSEGRMNYFFLCQYILELIEADFLVERDETLILTQEGEEAFAMFSDQLNDDDVKVLHVENVDYRITHEEDHTTYEKRIDGEMVFSLSILNSMATVTDEEHKEAIIENLIQCIKKASI